MSVALEDPRHRLDGEAQGDADDPPEANDERLSTVFFWWAVVMVFAVGSVILNIAHRS